MSNNDIKLDEEVLRYLTLRIIGIERENLLRQNKKTDIDMVKQIKKEIQEKVTWKLNQ